MSAAPAFAHSFVEAMPETLEPGRLYVSLGYDTMIHLCACGCGAEVVTPLSPTDWRFTYDGESVSVSPSIGSWELPCRSHYFIEKGRARFAGDWSKAQIERGRKNDRARKAERFGQDTVPAPMPIPTVEPETQPPAVQGRWSRFVAWVRSTFENG